jgi:hypothetical protein
VDETPVLELRSSDGQALNCPLPGFDMSGVYAFFAAHSSAV